MWKNGQFYRKIAKFLNLICFELVSYCKKLSSEPPSSPQNITLVPTDEKHKKRQTFLKNMKKMANFGKIH